MARPIDAGELKKEVESAFHGALGITVTGAVHEIIDRQPTIDPESLRPRGHWEKETADGPDVVKYTSLLSVFCSRCRRRAWTKSTYCPHCGAKMED